mmetsp:Transcript_61649/g.144360  ORF Transcript_61649/g.144360 Transcript_61649/m.144360 type:complete len:200 (-) Transcript_61649:935-1534(-)
MHQLCGPRLGPLEVGPLRCVHLAQWLHGEDRVQHQPQGRASQRTVLCIGHHRAPGRMQLSPPDDERRHWRAAGDSNRLAAGFQRDQLALHWHRGLGGSLRPLRGRRPCAACFGRGGSTRPCARLPVAAGVDGLQQRRSHAGPGAAACLSPGGPEAQHSGHFADGSGPALPHCRGPPQGAFGCQEAGASRHVWHHCKLPP